MWAQYNGGMNTKQDPESDDGMRLKRLVIGNKMTEAIKVISNKPGTYAITIDRLFGVKVRERLVKSGLVNIKTDETGDRFYANRLSVLPNELEPVADYKIRTHLEIRDEQALIQHNVLAALCPVCKSPAGQRCRSLKNGRPVNFPHQQRYGAAIYALSVLLALSNS